MIDIDRFKVVNDSHGHLVGDEVVKYIAEVLRNQVRDYDTVARLGGDEFMIFIEADAVQTQRVLERIMDQVEVERSYGGEQPFKVTLSCGCVEFSSEDRSLSIESLIKQADTLLYKAKASGRSTMVIEPVLLAGNTPTRRSH